MAQSPAPTAPPPSNPLEALRLNRDYVSNIVQSELSASTSRQRVHPLEWACFEPDTQKEEQIEQVELARRISARCEALFQAAACATSHLVKLDEVFSTFLYSDLQGSELTTEAITTNVITILSRLTAKPPAPQSLPSSLPSFYFEHPPSWETLHVVSFVPANLVRLVAHQVDPSVKLRRNQLSLAHILTEVANMINAVCERELEQSGYQWFIVRAFLWTFWQRLNTLVRYFQCKRNILEGFHGFSSDFEPLCPFSVRPGIGIAEFMARASREDKPDNMCSWALELIRNDPLCLGIDFRLLHQRFTSVFHGVKARCQPNSARPCDGLGPDCLRYKGTQVADQSVHDSTCSFHSGNEPKLKWNEASYRRVHGGRAVSVDPGIISGTTLNYCSASSRTLAISHVWVHGQGGRPEVGINQCLHQKYCRIAQQLGCNSYWMDTVSIPQNHQLRREAISNINTVFLDSCAVLVCDRDLMQVDVSNMTLPLLESLLVGVLICDWNVRAWTLLEAVKGRAKLHLLCKNNQTVDLQDLLQRVCSQGRLDVAIFANLLRHMLLKWEDSEKPMIFPRKLGIPNFMRGLVSRRRRQTVEIQIPVGLGGVWLSHRPASRPEDEIVIWSLLLGDLRPPLYNAVDFWRGNYLVDTGYLLSSCPRLNKRGLSWAPRTPYAMVQKSGPVPSPDRILPRHTTIGALGSIQRNGLWASWYVSEFDSQNQTSTQSQAQIGLELAKIRQRFHITKRYAALLQPIDDNDHRMFGEKRREDAVQPGRFGRQVAICESGKTRMKRERKGDVLYMPPKLHRWLWKGVYEWPDHVPMPDFQACYRFWIG